MRPGSTPGLLTALDRSALTGPTLEAARAVLGARLVREDATGRRVARITEIEAYIGEDDRASHARFGKTARNAVMYGAPGHAYVYLVYGMHDCLNVVTEPAGSAAALLIRAVDPLEGLDVMRVARILRAGRARRGWTPERAQRTADRLAGLAGGRLTDGPGLVTGAFGIDTTWSGADLCDPASALRLEPRPAAERLRIATSSRIGIAYAGEPWTSVPWRFSVVAP